MASADKNKTSARQPAQSRAEPATTPALNLDRYFTTLEAQLALAAEIADRIVSKHWHAVEKEQYPFWIGIIILSLLGMIGMYAREVSSIAALIIATLMGVFMVILIGYSLVKIQGRFERQWSLYATDGEMFRFLTETGSILNYPIELGFPDEHFSSRFEIPFEKIVKIIEEYLKSLTLPEPVGLDHPPGFFIPPHVLKNPPGGDTHRVYEVEYRGLITRALSIRIASLESAANITIGYAIRPKNAETRDRLSESLLGRIHDRFMAAKIFADIRRNAGLPPVEIRLPSAEHEINAENESDQSALK